MSTSSPRPPMRDPSDQRGSFQRIASSGFGADLATMIAHNAREKRAITSNGYKLPPIDSLPAASTSGSSSPGPRRAGRPLSHAQTMPVLGFAAQTLSSGSGHPFLAGPPTADPFLSGRNSGRELQPLFETRAPSDGGFSRAASLATPIGEVANGPVSVGKSATGASGDGFDLDEVLGASSTLGGAFAIPAFNSTPAPSGVFDPEAAGRSKSSIAHNGGTKRVYEDAPPAAEEEEVETEPEDEVAPLPTRALGKRTFGRSATVPSLPSGALEMDVDF